MNGKGEERILANLCLGTVQFGMNYGINNQEGQPTQEACFEMLDTAMENGINVIDTARAYGTAEIVVGDYLEYRKCCQDMKIISKLRPNIIEPYEKDAYSVIRRELEGSLERLHVQRLDGYLLHTPEYIYDERIVEALFRLREEHIVQNIGISIYNMDEGYEAIRKGMNYIQLPYSVLDQRGVQSGLIREAKKADMTVFTRSTFLQGLFLMDIDKIPNYLEHAKPYLKHFEKLTEEYKIGKIELLLQFVKEAKEVDYLVFGVDSKSQLLEDIKEFQTNTTIDQSLIRKIKEFFIQVEDGIILPSLWSNGRKAE